MDEETTEDLFIGLAACGYTLTIYPTVARKGADLDPAEGTVWRTVGYEQRVALEYSDGTRLFGNAYEKTPEAAIRSAMADAWRKADALARLSLGGRVKL